MKIIANKLLGLMVMASVLVIWGCSEEEDPIPANMYEKISGTWLIDEMNLFGTDIPGDGSTLSFNSCDEPPCTGNDFSASDETTGEFTYQFIENDTKIEIIDEDLNGGNYHATWSIQDFESKSLRMTGEFGLFGSMRLDMSK
jgi:hypothetical protein